jgi:pimeloyl-ACP methyl ester carboxylesterase
MPELAVPGATVFYEQLGSGPDLPFLSGGAERDGDDLAAQWQACADYSCLARLPQCSVPLHAIAFTHDVQTAHEVAKVVADTAPDGHFHLFEGYGHLSIHGHAHGVLNPLIRELAKRYP